MVRELLFDVSKFEVNRIGTPADWFYREWCLGTTISKRFLSAEYFEYNHSYTIHYLLGVM